MAKSVLVVEDEISMLQVLAQKLQEAGLTVYRAKDGEEGLTTAAARHPDVILLDLLMPKMDGMHMLEHLRKESWGQHIPIIILTNVNPDTDTTMKGIIAFQPVYYLIKAQTKLEEVVAKVQEVVTLKKPS